MVALDEEERELEERLEQAVQDMSAHQHKEEEEEEGSRSCSATVVDTQPSHVTPGPTKDAVSNTAILSRSRSLSASGMTIKPSMVTGVRKNSLTTTAPKRPVSDQGKRPQGNVQQAAAGGDIGSDEAWEKEGERESQPTPVEEVSGSARQAWSH